MRAVSLDRRRFVRARASADRLDGWANRDLNIGAIVALAPNLQPIADLLGVDEATVRAVLNSWGPGKFDAELILDGKGVPTRRQDRAATLIPPAFGLAGVNLHTWTGWGSVTHWNAFVANLEMHGKGTFFDPRLDDARQFPIARAEPASAHVRSRRGSDHAEAAGAAVLSARDSRASAAARAASIAPPQRAARTIFNERGECATCHVPPLFTEPGWNMHTRGRRSASTTSRPTGRRISRYRTSPLKGLWTHTKGGFYHDGRFATLRDVVEHYDTFFGLRLTTQEKLDLIEYLKSL